MENIKTKLLAATAVFLTSTISQGALTPLGGEYPLLGDIVGHQQNPHVAVGPTGGFVVWQNATSDGKGERIAVQRLGGDYTGVGSTLVASQNMAGSNDVNPRVSILPSGGAAVTWESGPRASTDVYVRFLDAQGNFLGGAQRVNTHATGIQTDADVATLSGGQTLVVWTSLGQDGDGEGVYGQRFTSQGVRDGAEFLINQTTARNQSKASVAALAGDRFVVGWISESSNGRNSSGAPNLRANVMARQYSGAGAALGNEYRLNDGDIVSSEVQVASDSGGGFVVAWVQQDEVNMNNLSDVFVKSFDANGLPSGQSSRHNTFLKGRQEAPGLAILGNDALVAWTSYGQDAGGAGVQGRLVSGGTEFAVNSQGNLHQKTPAVGSNGENKYLAVWVNTIRPDHSVLSAQRYLVVDGSDWDDGLDVTAGVVEVVGAEIGRRRTNPQAASSQASVATEQQPVATLNISPSPPQVSSVAPAVAAVQQQVASTPQAVSTPSPSPAPVTAVTQPSARVSQAASTAMRSMSQLQSRTRQPIARMSTRQPQLRNANMAAQSSLLRQARSRTQSSSSVLNRARPSATSLSRTAFLRQPLQSSAMNRSSYARMSTRGSQRSTSPGIRSLGSRAGSARQLASSTGSRATGLQRMNTRQPTTAATRFGSMMSRGRNSAADAASSAMRPVSASVSRTAARGVRLNWVSQNGARYQVQSSNDRTSWRNVGTSRNGRQGTDSMAIQSGGPRYYRVVRKN